MDLVLIMKNPDTGRRETRRFSSDEVIVGAADTCDLVVPGLAALSFSLTYGKSGDLRLHRKDSSLALTVNREPMTGQDTIVANGDVLHVGDYEISLAVAFDRTDHRISTGLVPILTMLTIILVIVAELAFAIRLPRQIAGQELWADEYVRQKTLSQLDRLRGGVAFWLLLKEIDENARQTLLLIKEEADRMAAYIRKHEDQMQITQYNVFRNDMDRLQVVFERIRNEKQFPEDNPVDLTPALKLVLEEAE